MIPVAFLAVLLLQAPATRATIARIVGDTAAPVSLVGDVCNADSALRALPRQVAPEGQRPQIMYGSFQSAPFYCLEMCNVGFRANTSKSISSIDIGYLKLGERKRWYNVVVKRAFPQTFHDCHGEPAVQILIERTLPTESALLYVAAVQFADGSSWELPNRVDFIKRTVKAWKER